MAKKIATSTAAKELLSEKTAEITIRVRVDRGRRVQAIDWRILYSAIKDFLDAVHADSTPFAMPAVVETRYDRDSIRHSPTGY